MKLKDVISFLDKEKLRKELKRARIDKTPYQIILFSLAIPTVIFVIGVTLSIVLLSDLYLVISIVSVALVTIVSLFTPHYYIKLAQGTRRRKINRNLGSAITFMYALSSGNMKLPEIFRRLAIHEEAFGEASREAKLIVTEIDFFSSDLESAVNELIKITPSEKMKDFLTDLIPVMRAGGDISTYLSDRSEQFLNEALEDQENFIEFLGYLSEGYIAGFVAGPLLIILGIVILILSFGQAPAPLYYIIYLLLPLGGLFFIVLLKMISPIEAISGGKTKLKRKRGIWFFSSEKSRLETSISRRLNVFFKSLAKKPTKTLIISTPILSIFFLYTALSSGLSEIIQNIETYSLVLLIGLITPISIFYEFKNFRNTQIRNEFPDFLRILEGLNKTGMNLKQTILEASGIPGIVGNTLKDIKRGLKWDLNLEGLLKYFSNKLNEKQITRSVIIILEGTRSHSNISSVLNVTKEDAVKRRKLKERRKTLIRPYILLVWIAFLIFVFTAYIFQVQFLGSIPSGAGVEGGRFGFSMGQVEIIRDIISHSSMIMGFISGIIAGELSQGTILAGLKHSMFMVIVAYTTFFVLI